MKLSSRLKHQADTIQAKVDAGLPINRKEARQLEAFQGYLKVDNLVHRSDILGGDGRPSLNQTTS